MTLRNARLVREFINCRLAYKAVIPFRGQVPRCGIDVCAQRSSGRIESAGRSHQTQEAIVGNVFRGLDRTQQPKRESKDWVAVTLVQDLEGRRVSARCCLEQPFVC